MAESSHVKTADSKDQKEDEGQEDHKNHEDLKDDVDYIDIEDQKENDNIRESTSRREYYSERNSEVIDLDGSNVSIESINTKRRKSRFKLVNTTQEAEDSFDLVAARKVHKPCGVVHSIAHLVKGALGAGILSGHVAFMKAGLLVAVPFTILFGCYMGYCLHVLIRSAQTLYRRTAVPLMTYSDVGEAAMACHPNPRIRKHAMLFRYSIDTIISIDLYGSCAAYQIIIATTLKQLTENTQTISSAPITADYPHLRVYLAAMIVPCILICLLRHLQWLAPFSIIANMFILLTVIMTVSYAFKFNQNFEELELVTTFTGAVEFMGMIVFSLSNAGVVLPIENSMKEPEKFDKVLLCALTVTVSSFLITSFFGYAAFGEKSQVPITINFPMTIYPKVIKFCIAIMIYVTHALNFWVPFQLCFHYLSQLHKTKHLVWWELLYRASFVVMISITALLFPSIIGIIEFIGCFCLTNMAFIWPNMIQLLVIWERPGFGKCKWMLWRCLLFIAIGVIFWICGTIVAVKRLVQALSVYTELDEDRK